MRRAEMCRIQQRRPLYWQGPASVYSAVKLDSVGGDVQRFDFAATIDILEPFNIVFTQVTA